MPSCAQLLDEAEQSGVIVVEFKNQFQVNEYLSRL